MKWLLKCIFLVITLSECDVHRVNMRRRIKSWFNTQTQVGKEKEDKKSQYHSQIKQRDEESKETKLTSTKYSGLYDYMERHPGVRTEGKSNSAEWYIEPGERNEKELEAFDSKRSEVKVITRQRSERPSDVTLTGVVSDEAARTRQTKSLSTYAKPKTAKKSKMKVKVANFKQTLVEGKKERLTESEKGSGSKVGRPTMEKSVTTLKESSGRMRSSFFVSEPEQRNIIRRKPLTEEKRQQRRVNLGKIYICCVDLLSADRSLSRLFVYSPRPTAVIE